MSSVPRLSDSVLIIRQGEDQFSVQVSGRHSSIDLSASGYDLLCRMDGVSTPEEVRQEFATAWGLALSEDDFEEWMTELKNAGVFVVDSRAVEALRHLRQQGVHFRGGRPDRRARPRQGDRRAESEPRSQRFDRAVFLLNSGRLEESLELFTLCVEELPGDVRVQELAQHLSNLLEGSIPPGGERRDITWEVFDSALQSFLESGSCPNCSTQLDVEVGDLNRCRACGAAYSSFLLKESNTDRRFGR